MHFAQFLYYSVGPTGKDVQFFIMKIVYCSHHLTENIFLIRSPGLIVAISKEKFSNFNLNLTIRNRAASSSSKLSPWSGVSAPTLFWLSFSLVFYPQVSILSFPQYLLCTLSLALSATEDTNSWIILFSLNLSPKHCLIYAFHISSQMLLIISPYRS